MISGIKIITQLSSDEIVELNDLIREKNQKGLLPKLIEKKAEPGSMSLGEYLPVIQLVLGSTAVAAGIKGIFDVIKYYFSMREKKILSNTEIEKSKLELYKIDFQIETKDGIKTSLKFSSFDEDERNNFFEIIDGLINS